MSRMSNNSRQNVERAAGLGLYPTTPQLFAASADPGTSTAPHFTSDDRTTLRLIYHQQQALQVQLNTVLTWMQQVDQRLAAIERRQPEAQEPTTVSNRDRSRHTSEVASRPNISAIGESRSCTPPGEDINRSLLDRSVESASGAAPWDPSSHAAVDTSRASHTSQLGRQENPLLSSRLSAAPSQRPAVSRPTSRVVSQPQSTNTTVLTTGYSAEHSRLSQPERPQRQPQQQQPVLAPAMAAATATERGIPTYRRPVSAPADPYLTQRAAPPSTNLHAAVEKYSTGSATPTEHIKPPQQQQTAQRPTTVPPQDSAPTTSSGTTQRTRVFYDPKGKADLDYDSLSDGYGSYESRQYIKQIGLL